MKEEEFMTLFRTQQCDLKDAYYRFIHYCKREGYDLKAKAKLARKLFTDEQIEMLEEE